MKRALDKEICEPLKPTAYVTNAATAMVTHGRDGYRTRITSIILHNTHTSSLWVRLHRVPVSSGSVGTAAASNRFLHQVIPTLGTVVLGEEELSEIGIVLKDVNDTLQAIAQTTDLVTLTASGIVE